MARHQLAAPVEPAASAVHQHDDRAARVSWARLLKRVFGIDLEHHPNCGGEFKIIAAILEAQVIEWIITHLALQARAQPQAAPCGEMQPTA